ncbi:hypothetical protein SteCoe_25337 [Stentor coeruleus]|uniref:dolichyl-P-Man:Man5GlcNAc2-PP-dolichol alpha-1,3-mannosyltransferase n=1 Tax=Stentor coeruleus TaxID=5963 RepID=A0A1R2BFC7_9CILI|nr:hypothetical protein SteCoe_25337 [Stentor coeruleus]
MVKLSEWLTDIRVLLILELIGGMFIINFRGYTEVDWEAYMAQTGGFLSGDYNYLNLKGPSGPLVYPAGFLYIFSIIYSICNMGTSVRMGQYVFLAFYLINLIIVNNIYKRLEPHVGKWCVFILCLSFKMHSTYLLRLFNDPVAILFMNLCILFALDNKWKSAVILYSISLSIKMNILLYLPGLLLIINWGNNYIFTLCSLIFIIAFQLIIAIPFLLVNPRGYFTMAFDFSRVFDQKESAYWQFLPNEVFVSKIFHNTLLVFHVTLLLIFLFRKAAYGKTFVQKLRSLNLPTSLAEFLHPPQGTKIAPELIAYSMFTTHFIGIFFSRSLHIQYYTWYIFTIPFFICYGSRKWWKYGLYVLLEVAYKQYPPKLYSSCMVFAIHLVFIYVLDSAFEKVTPRYFKDRADKETKKNS